MRLAALAPWLLPLVPLGTGAGVMIAGGAPRSRWVAHLCAGAVGLAAGLAGRAVPRVTAGVPVALALIAATLASDGIQEVTRWIRLGPVLLHPSALLTPLLLVLACRQIAARPGATLLGLGLLQALHVAQPDAGQATSLGVAALVLLLLAGRPALGAARTLGAAGVIAGTVALAWARPDPLGPAPFVEDIVSVAFRLGPLAGALALASLVALVIAPLTVRNTETARPGILPAGAVLSTYLACSAAVVLVGEFPVPVLGFGASPVVGTFLGIGMLARTEHAGVS